MKKLDIIIIGAGFAGLSTAYHLAKAGKRDVLILEQERVLGGHASGNNAGMIRQALSDPFLTSLAKEGCAALKKAAKSDWKGLKFKANGSLLLAKKKEVRELRKIAATLKRCQVSYSWRTCEDISKNIQVLEGADFESALFCPTDAFIDIRALLMGFLRKIASFEIPVRKGIVIEKIREKNDGFQIETNQGSFFSRVLVNAAGAWSNEVASLAGTQKMPLKPYRRHLFESTPLKASIASWPFVWDLSHGLYFRPLPENALLLSPCDQTAVGRKYTAARKEKIDPAMQKKLFSKLDRFSAHFKDLKIKKEKSGLRTMAPDGRFIIGEDPRLKRFYWVAGLGGHGVTTSFSVGRLAADFVMGRKVNRQMARALSPVRFSGKGK